MKFFNQLTFIGILTLVCLITSCKKDKPYDVTTPPAQAHFVGSSFQTYSVATDPVPVFNVQVGATNVANSDRIVTYKVSSPSGAVEGTQYTLGTSGTVTIPAGAAVANIDIHAVYAQYSAGRRDTLVFTLSTPSLDISSFMDTLTVVIKGVVSCSEDAIELTALLGDYNNTNEVFDGTPYGPYPTSISAVNQTSPTTGTVTVENIFDSGWGSITFNLDWTDPNNRTCIVVDEAIPNTNAGDIFGAQYDGASLVVTAPFGTIGGSPVGTYSFCDETFTLQMEIGIDGVGFYPSLYTVNMER